MLQQIHSGTVLCAVAAEKQFIYLVLPGYVLFICSEFQHNADHIMHAFYSSISLVMVWGGP